MSTIPISSSLPQYTLAIARQVPTSFPKAITKFAESSNDIDLKKSIRQHEDYLKTLRLFVPTLVLPAVNALPDSLFVEDTVVAVGNKAVMTYSGHPQRRGEVDSIRRVLSDQLGMTVTNIGDKEAAFCDGGDVLYTSRHLFVGLSERTNRRSLHILEESLDIQAIPVPFQGNALHLKSIVTHVDDSTLLAPTGRLGDQVLDTMDALNRGYTVIRLPNMLACNVVSVNGGLVAQDVGDGQIRAILEDIAAERNMHVEFVSCSEIAKADGALTCCSVLLNI